MSEPRDPATAGLNALLGVVAMLRGLGPAGDDVDRIARIRLFEDVKAAAAAAQAVEVAGFEASQRALQRQLGERSDKIGRGVPNQVALAMGISPARARRVLTRCRRLTSDLPRTLAALREGRASEYRAELVATATSHLDKDLRRLVDAEVAPHLHEWSDRRTEGETRRRADALDPAAAVARNAHAVSERRTSLRAAPDTMTYFGALLPVADGVAVHATLTRHAESARNAGDTRSRGQLMADALVDLVTRRRDVCPVQVQLGLVMTDRALLGAPGTPGRDEPGWLEGYGPIPAQTARDLITQTRGDDETDDDSDAQSPLRADAVDEDVVSADGSENAEADSPSPGTGRRGRRRKRKHAGRFGQDAGEQKRGSGVWLRRLFRDPVNGELIAMDSRARAFPAALQRFVRYRDQTCRTPGCDAPIRHIDHVRPDARGGPTSARNANGLCEACNYAKEAPGWRHDVITDDLGRTVTAITTPTGHQYRSRPPDPPGTDTSPDWPVIELLDSEQMLDLLCTAA